ncbi:SLAP domain-containing protein [Lactobacillus crispatus]|uniref:SLAP domain-containing protein n=1 Tax=Lactobacillus crispatus TaxID=47770 RepID=UPI00336AA223
MSATLKLNTVQITIKGKKYYKISGNRYTSEPLMQNLVREVVLKHLANVYDKNGKINHDFQDG